MKKVSLLVALCISGSISVWGQHVLSPMQVDASLLPRKNSVDISAVKPVEMEKTPLKLDVNQLRTRKAPVKNPIAVSQDLKSFRLKNDRMAKADESLFAGYLIPNGALHTGVDIESGGIYGTPTLVLPAFRDVTFYNAYTEGVTYEWLFDSYTLDEFYTSPADYSSTDEYSNLTYSIPAIRDGLYYLAPTVQATKDGETASYSYCVGSYAPDGETLIERGTASYGMSLEPLSKADYWGHGGYYYIFDENMYYGTGSTMNGKECTAVASVLEPAAPLYVQSMNILVSAMNEGEAIMPDGSELTLTIYKIDGNNITDEVIASATAAMGTDITQTSWTSGLYAADFKFYETASDGFREQVSLTLDEPCAIFITGFDQPGCNLVFPFTVDLFDLAGTGYLQYGDEFTYFSLDSYPNYNATHLALQIVGSYTCFERTDENVVEVPVEGGLGVSTVQNGQSYNDVDVYSTYPVSDEDGNSNLSYAIDYYGDTSSEWLQVYVLTEEYFDEYNILAFGVQGDALPSGVEGRSARVTLYSLGAQCSFVVNQGNVTAISTVAADDTVSASVADGNLLLSNVQEGTPVSVYAIDGKLALSAAYNGNAVSMAALADGLYIVKVGDKTVKVIK